MATPYYTREESDARFEALKYELRSDIKESEGRLRSEIGQVRTEVGLLRTEVLVQIAGLRGEWKTWMLLLGAFVAVTSSGLGARILNQVWPPGPVQVPPGPAAPFGR